jgi:hypothetical protein
MLFKLLQIETEKAYTEKTLFSSYDEMLVWKQYLKQRGTENFSHLYVKDSSDSFINPPSWVSENFK